MPQKLKTQGVKSTKRPHSILQSTAGRGMQGPKLRITRHSGSLLRNITSLNFVRHIPTLCFARDIPTSGGSCSSWWQHCPLSHLGADPAGLSPSAKDHYYFLSCLSLKAAFISPSPFCQNVSLSSFSKYHLRCLQPKGKQEKHFSLLLSNQSVAGSRLPGAPLL